MQKLRYENVAWDLFIKLIQVRVRWNKMGIELTTEIKRSHFISVLLRLRTQTSIYYNLIYN